MLWIGVSIGLIFGFALGTFLNYRSYERGYKDGKLNSSIGINTYYLEERLKEWERN